ncbi:hypothetical protein F4809DRAFT_163784 [Biscogniauxia mediterranea]|nr:hypothetical protein F4809DRAFT_163784 [Biscogniauxia mediterranea]
MIFAHLNHACSCSLPSPFFSPLVSIFFILFHNLSSLLYYHTPWGGVIFPSPFLFYFSVNLILF